jgi:hypothetical protein
MSETGKHYYRAHKKQWKKYKAAYMKTHRAEVNLAQRAYKHKYAPHLRQRYGLTKEAWEALVRLQNGRCALCCRVARLVVDHDHHTKINRGLLCHRCNLSIGFLEDGSTTLEAVGAYLKRGEK